MGFGVSADEDEWNTTRELFGMRQIKKKSEEGLPRKNDSDRRRGQTRISIGVASQKRRELTQERRLKDCRQTARHAYELTVIVWIIWLPDG